jgi:arylsulfatase A-like enzyme
LITGQRPQTHGIFINDTPMNPDATTLPKVLKNGGYDTACIGKWHIDGHGRSAFIPRERRQGFDYWKVLECTHDYNNSPYYADRPELLKWDGYDAIAQTRDTQEYLKSKAKSDKPFFLWLAWGPPHNPYETAPAKYKAMYSPKDIVLRDNVPDAAKAEARKELAGYYAHCTALDDCMRDILQTLKESGLDQNTIVIFTSDHGDMLESQGQHRKQRPWEESARVPMLFRFPSSSGIQPKHVEGTINSEDIMPTVLSLCGMEIPKSVEGFDFNDYLHGGSDPSAGATVIRCITPFGEFTRAQGGREYRMVRSARYTYARDLKGPWLLYDNLNDPKQLVNLIGDPKFAQLQTEQDALLTRKLTEQHDEFLPGAEYIKKWGYKVDPSGTMPHN